VHRVRTLRVPFLIIMSDCSTVNLSKFQHKQNLETSNTSIIHHPYPSPTGEVRAEHGKLQEPRWYSALFLATFVALRVSTDRTSANLGATH